MATPEEQIMRPWIVTSQRQTTELGPNGRTRDIMVITFQTFPSGSTGEIKVPIADYSVENVARILEERAALMEAVHSL